MLTKEQIKSLKKGDKLLVETSVENVFTDGDIQVRVKTRMIDHTIGESLATLHSSCLSLTKPKYDPCRRFKKGDIVRIVEWNGRSPVIPRSAYKVGDICTIMKDEYETSYYVRVESADKREQSFLFGFLELVTSAEDLEIYKVETNQYGYHIENRLKEKAVATYNDEVHPNAYEAAVAECKRLNEEWRKNHERR